MKTENALFISVNVTKNNISVAGSFDYNEAKETMIKMQQLMLFDIYNDDAIIYKFEKEGQAEAVFNYRAYLNQEPDKYTHAQKSNGNVKIFFECPKCHGHKFKLVTDEDGDILANCSNKDCNHYELIQN